MLTVLATEKRMKRFSTTLLSTIVIGLTAIAVHPIFAADPTSSPYGLETAGKEAGLNSSSLNIPSLIGKFLGSILGFTGTLFFVLVVYAGLMWMTAAGSEDRIKKAKQILIAAVIGLVIVLSAYAITQYIGTALG